MKLTGLEKRWIAYDVGNSAFILLATTIIPIVFKTLAKESLDAVEYLAYWGYAVSLATFIPAILGPILGAVADKNESRKGYFLLFVLLGVAGCISLPFWKTWVTFLLGYVIARVGFNGSLVFYDSMLIDITEEERMDHVSSLGYAWGYLGSCVPFVLSILLMLKGEVLGISTKTSTLFVFLLNGLWWLFLTFPLLKSYEQRTNTARERRGESVREVFPHMINTLKEIKTHPRVFLFLLAFLFYIDGVYTIINMATAYGSSLGLSDTGLILALLLTQVVAFPCALFFGRLSKTVPTDRLLKICILAYGIIALYAVQLDKLYEFWILAVGVGGFQGAIQALSRSYYAKIIPEEKSGEYFGIYDIFGKGASLLGTLMVSAITQLTGNQHLSILSLVLMFLLGYFFFKKASNIDF